MAKELHLSCLDKPVTKVVHAVQGDTGRKLNIYIDDRTITSTMVYTFVAEKPSGLKIYNSATYVPGCVQVKLTSQTLAEVGNVKAQIQITDTDGITTSYMFYIQVDEIYKDESSMESSNEYTALTAMQSDFANIKGQFDEVIAGVTVDSEVIGARVGADGTQYSTLSNRLNAENTALNEDLTEMDSRLSESIENIVLDGTSPFIGAKFVVGGLDRMEVSSYYKWRVCSENLLHFDTDITVSIKDDFRLLLNEGNADGSFIKYSEWYTKQTIITKDKYFKLLIARVNEDTSETATVKEFSEAIKIITNSKTKTDDIEHEIDLLNNIVSAIYEKEIVTYPNSGFINLTGSAVANPDFHYSDYIKADKLDTNVEIYKHSLVATFSFYDDNKNYLSYYQVKGSNGLQRDTVVIPNNAVYVVACTDTSYDNKVYYRTSVIEKMQNDIGSFNLDNHNLLKYKDIAENIGFVGRWYPYTKNGNTYQATNNSGSELYFRVKNAESVQIEFDTFSEVTALPYIAISIDGGDFTRQQIWNKTITLPDEKEHIVRVVVDGMDMNGKDGQHKYNNTNGVYLKSYPNTLKGIMPLNKIIAFFGDSITEGIRAYGVGDNANYYSAFNAYPMFCCNKLNAVSHRVGYGSTRMYPENAEGTGGSFGNCLTAVNYYQRYLETPNEVFDAIVINHGVNDSFGNVSTENYISAYRDVIERLRVKYSSTPIFCVVGFRSIQPYSEALKSLCDEYSNTYFVSSAGWNGETTDGTHLSVNGAKNNGELLADEILKVLGKAFFEC